MQSQGITLSVLPPYLHVLNSGCALHLVMGHFQGDWTTRGEPWGQELNLRKK